ncbi:helix-turn-helix transcriptional regulator [Kitasatospora sp. NPDC090308]|uniref:helix-turn-helix domain-containing protein n=1 Tax=Kitasatospora sp. NPDC090308 TaxID=3364082 RepID=UPI00382B577F
MAAQERTLHPERSVRDLFGFHLRRMRKERGLSLADLAAELMHAKTVLADVETAVRPIPRELPKELDEFFGVGGIFGHLYKLSYLEAFPDWSRRFMELEPLASQVWKYAANLFPGLWQTEEYGLAALRLGLPRADSEEIERVWSTRAARQSLLCGDNPPFIWVVLDESVIRRQVGGPAVMARQIEHVLKLADGPHATVQVLPFSAGAHGVGSSITLLDFLDAPRVVYAEGYGTGQLLDSTAEVQDTALAYTRLQAAALSPEESKPWLRCTMEELLT